MDDVKQYIYTTLSVFAIGVVVWVGFIFYNSCGFSFACKTGQAKVERTPIPSLVPGTLPAYVAPAPSGECKVGATDLMAAWVNAGSPEKDTFTFSDVNGAECTATFTKDLWPLMNTSNVWYKSSLSCTSCHNADLATSDAQLDLSTYEGMMAGSRRADGAAKGEDIFGGGNWEKSKLYELMVTHTITADGHPADLSASGPVIYAGSRVEVPTQTPAPTQAPATPTVTP